MNETLPRNSKTNLQWYMLTGYTDWRGSHVFLDTKLDIAYGNLDGQRVLSVGDQFRIAQGKRASLLASLGATTGVLLKYGAFDVTPHISLDGMTMREEGYTETGGGDGFDLQVAPYYASSLRTSLGVDGKTSFSLWDATITPEMRLGYRYDFVGAPVKLKAAFVSTGGLTSPNNQFTVIGPDPDTGNLLAGFSLGGGTDTWNIGINYDWIRGNNASTTQVGTITLLGRIPRRYQLPLLGIEAQGSLGARASPCCSNSIEIPSGERMKAMYPSRGGRLMVTPATISFSHSA